MADASAATISVALARRSAAASTGEHSASATLAAAPAVGATGIVTVASAARQKGNPGADSKRPEG